MKPFLPALPSLVKLPVQLRNKCAVPTLYVGKSEDEEESVSES